MTRCHHLGTVPMLLAAMAAASLAQSPNSPSATSSYAGAQASEQPVPGPTDDAPQPHETCATCPPDGILELEPNCGLPTDFTDGGCVSSSPVFKQIACGQTVCGTAASNGSVRDTDWYQIVVTQSTTLTWSAIAEFDFQIGVVANNGIPSCSGNPQLDPGVFFTHCQAGSVSKCVTPGTWWLFFAPQFSAVAPCGSEYHVTLTCSVCTTALPPANDTCASATEIFDGDTPIDTTNATTNSPGVSCGLVAHDIWFDYQAICTTTLTASTCNQANFDTVISVYDGANNVCANPTLLACSDDVSGCGLNTSRVTVPVVKDHWYKIRVGGFSNTDSGTGILTLSSCPPTGACCNPPACSIATQAACQTQGGFYQGDRTDCVAAFQQTVIPGNFTDIAAAGAPFVPGVDGTDDGTSAALPLGFSFHFYGSTVLQCFVNANGFLSFSPITAAQTYNNGDIPSAANPNNAIYALWDDLNFIDGGNCRYLTTGSPGHRVFIVQWSAVPQYQIPTTDANMFEIKLFEGSDVIEIHYLPVNSTEFEVTGGAPGTTIGIENGNGTAASRYFDPASARAGLHGGFTGLRFTPVAATDCNPSGACCTGSACVIRTIANCLQAQGSFLGAGTACPYQQSIITPTFTDISFTGTLVNGVSGTDDGVSGSLNIGFPFVYYGVTYTNCFVAMNGFLSFVAPPDGIINFPIPDPQPPNASVYAMWDDLISTASGTVWSQTIGSPGSHAFIVEWKGVQHINNATPNTFQIKLFENTNAIEMHYQVVSSFNDATGATIGIENLDGTNALQFATPTTARAALNGGGVALRYALAACGCTCPGDLSANGSVNGADIARFAQCLVGSSIGSPPGAGCACADVNADGAADLNDVNCFLQRELAGSCGPCGP